MTIPSPQEAAFAAIDFESTGEYAGETADPIQIGIAWMNGLQIDTSSFYQSYLKTEKPISWIGKKQHLISKSDLKKAPSFLSLWPNLEQRLSHRYLVAHGRGTEKRFLRTFPLHGLGPWIDTLSLSRTLEPKLSSYQLSDLIFHFGLEKNLLSLLPNFRWHEALSDAVATLVLLICLIKKHQLTEQPITYLLS